MRTLNTYYKDINSLDSFLSQNSVDKSKEILIQVFSSTIDEQVLTRVLSDILNLLPDAKVIGATTDGEILGKDVSTDRIVLSISEFEHSTLNIAGVDNENDSCLCGEKLALKIIQEDTKLLLLFADGLSINGEFF